ncbi:hypothetical protein RSAG8_07695, partial [Rhizoctonia solani AG-8 WAC10335]
MLSGSGTPQFTHSTIKILYSSTLGSRDQTTLQNILINLDRHLASDHSRSATEVNRNCLRLPRRSIPNDSVLQTLKAFVGSDYAERVTLYLSPGKNPVTERTLKPSWTRHSFVLQ